MWERWSIPITVLPPDTNSDFGMLHREMGGAVPHWTSCAQHVASEGRASPHKEEARRRQVVLESAIRRRLEMILTSASGRREHIPPADGLGGELAWFEISSDSSDSWSGMDMLKQLLSSPPQLGSG